MSREHFKRLVSRCQELMKKGTSNSLKLVNVNLDLTLVFVTINKEGMKINADVNVKNWLAKEYVIKDLFGIQVIVNVDVINHVKLENI